jgi:hypothetical protein
MDNNRISIVKTKYQAWIEKNNKLFLDLIANPYMIDTQYKYLDWLVGAFQRKKVDMSLADIIELIEQFDECSSHLDRKNLYSYNDIYDLQTCVVAYLNKTSRDEAKELENEQSNLPAQQEVIYYSYTEFIEELYKKIVETYPREFKIEDKVVECKYETDSEGFIKLFYTIPFYNTIIHVALHLFDSDSPLTIQAQDKTSSQEGKKKNYRLSFYQTAFKNRSICFNLLNKNEDIAMCLRLIEFSVALFVSSPEFQQTFSAEHVYWKGNHRELDGPTEELLKYIKEKQESGSNATKFDYVANHLGRPQNNVRSFQNKLFSDLKKASVIDIKKIDNGYTYVLGQNYLPFVEGRLKNT